MADDAALIHFAELEQRFAQAGLRIDGACVDLQQRAQQWRHGGALIEDLTPEETDTLGARMPLLRARAGQVLIHEGETGDWMLLVLAGTVDVVKTNDEGKLSRLAVIAQGTAVGEMSMLDAAPRNATCRAIEDVEAGLLTRTMIAHLIQDHPAIGAKLLVKLTQLLAQRLRNTSSRLVKLLQATRTELQPEPD